MVEQKEEGTTTLDSESPNQDDSKEVNKTSVKAITVNKNNSFDSINLFDPTQLIAAENYLKRVIRTEKSGIKTVEEGFAVLMRAQDLKLPFSSCVEHIHVINGKTGVDIHIIKALLLRAGCTWRCIKDYQPLYEYTDGINVYIDGSFPDYIERCISVEEATKKAENNKNVEDKIYIYPVKWYKDFNGNIYKNYQLNSNKFSIVINKIQADAVTKQGKIPVYRIPNVPVDFITEYEISRKINDKEISTTGRFTYNEAVVAEMFKKDTYIKYARILIGHRAFTYAARDIASDVLFGVLETTELKIVTGAELEKEDVIEITDAEIIK